MNAQPSTAPLPKTNKKSIWTDIGPKKLFFLFMFSCFAGTVIEMFWRLLTQNIWETRRGLIYGPFNLVYGFGALLVLILLYRLKSNLAIFIGSAFIGGAFEYVCSLFQEIAFGTVSWSYEKSPLNLHGRTNAGFMIAWGILGLVFMNVIFPRLLLILDEIDSLIPSKLSTIIAIGLAIFMVINAFLSFSAIFRQSLRRQQIPPQTSFDEFLDETYPDTRLKKLFPSMQLVTDEGKEGLWKNIQGRISS